MTTPRLGSVVTTAAVALPFPDLPLHEPLLVAASILWIDSPFLLHPIAQSLQCLNEPLLAIFRSGCAQAFVGGEKIDGIARDDHCYEGFEDKSRVGVFSATTEQDAFPIELVDDTVE